MCYQGNQVLISSFAEVLGNQNVSHQVHNRTHWFYNGQKSIGRLVFRSMYG